MHTQPLTESTINNAPHSWFRHFAARASASLGHPRAFMTAVAVVLLWTISGPFLRYSASWQTTLNMSMTIVTFLMLFLLQNTQIRDSTALHLKLNELLRAVGEARTTLVALETESDDRLEELQSEFAQLAVNERARSGNLPGQAQREQHDSLKAYRAATPDMVESAELAQDVAADVARADPADEVYDDERWRWMDAALFQARLALDAGEAPIGAVVVGQDGRVVSAAFNTMFGTGNPIAHAEINALGLTARKIVSRESLTLVTTLEPCVMCADAAMQSGVRRIVFGMKAPAEACLQRTQAFNANVATNPVWEGGLRSTESRRLFEAWLTRHEGDTDRIQQRAFVRQLLAST